MYAVGQAGTVLRRRLGKWESLPQAIREDLWSCVWFEDTLYASSYKQLFMLENDELCTVELPDRKRAVRTHQWPADRTAATFDSTDGGHDDSLLGQIAFARGQNRQ